MRVFKEMNKTGGAVCPVCKTANNGEVVLIGIEGTEVGHNIKAKQFHLNCLNLIFIPEKGLIYQITPESTNK